MGDVTPFPGGRPDPVAEVEAMPLQYRKLAARGLVESGAAAVGGGETALGCYLIAAEAMAMAARLHPGPDHYERLAYVMGDDIGGWPPGPDKGAA